MPTYQKFEDLPVWQDAIKLAEGCEDFLIVAKKQITWSKRDQLDRCSLSVSNNIAEGFERGTTNELLAFLYIARGSAGETRSMLGYFQRRPALHSLTSQILNLKSLAESCSRQLRAWADALQNSDIRGQRHLNNHSRHQWQKAKQEKQGMDEWLAMQRNYLRKLPPDSHARVAFENVHGKIE